MDIFSFIKKNVSIEIIVSEYTTLKKAGSYLKARCPFHHEKTASFTISPAKEIFYCFGCHEGGDVIYFVSKIEQCSQKEATLLLAAKFNIEIPENTEEYKNNTTEKEKYFCVYKIVTSWLKLQLSQSSEAKNYIEKRGISKDMVSQFNIGYFPAGIRGIQSLIEFCKKESILVDDLISCHIIMPMEKFYYSPFEDRVIFPIQDTLARFCGFGGRVFREYDARAKYYNSQESDFFQKGNLLFGLSFAKEHIRTKKTVFIVEGYIDCILMAQYGYQNTVATLGTACSEHQLKQLSRYTDTLYFLYDGDKAGQQALLRVTEKCWKVNLEPSVIILPASHDPASYILEKKTMEELLQKTYSIFSFFIQEHSSSTTSLKTLQEKIQAISVILHMILQIPDAIKQALLLSEASKTLEIDMETLKKEFFSLQKKQFALKKTMQEKGEEKKSDQQEKAIRDNSEKVIAVMLSNPTALDPFLIELCQQSENKEIQSVAKKIGIFLENNDIVPEQIFDQLWNVFDTQERIIISKLITEYGQTLNEIDFKHFFQQFERQMFKKMVQFIKMQFFGKEEMLKELLILQKRFKREI